MRWDKRFAPFTVRHIEYANSLLLAITMLVIVALTFIVVYQVIMRYFFEGKTTWVSELAEYGMVFIIFFPLARIEQLGAHIRVDAVTMRLSQKMNIRLTIATLSMSLIIVGIFVWSSTRYALLALENDWNTSSFGLSIDQWPILAMIPLSLSLLWLNLLVSLIRSIVGLFPKGHDNS